MVAKTHKKVTHTHTHTYIYIYIYIYINVSQNPKVVIIFWRNVLTFIL